MNFSVNAPGHRAEKEARILPAVVKTRNQYSNAAPRFPLVAHLSGCARRARAYSAAMNAEPPSSSVLSSLWQQIRAVLDLVLDLSFKRFVTPHLVRMLYVLSLLAALMYAISWLFYSWWGIIVAPAAFLLYLIVARVTVELILAVFRIAEHIAPMGDEQGTRPAPKPRSFTDPVK